MSANDIVKPFEVFTGTAWQAETVKDMLEDNEIEAFFGDEIWGTDTRWDTAPKNSSGTVRVYVPQDDSESAKNIVERYYDDIAQDY